MSRKMPLVGILAAALVATLGVQEAQAHDKKGRSCKYDLTLTGASGTAEATITSDELRIEFRNALPDTLYTVWVDHKSRASGLLASDYPLAEGALARGVAPAFATTAPVFAGMGIDLNGVVTDSDGNAKLRVSLDYNLLKKGRSPVVSAELLMQGMNRVGGGWLRTYPVNPLVAASLQTVDPSTGLPVLPRSTAQGLTIQSHPDYVTHGHTPGVGGVDHSGAFKGDFPKNCVKK